MKRQLLLIFFAVFTVTIFNAHGQNCSSPTLLSATNVTSTSAVLSWSNPSNAISWEVKIQSTGSGTPTEAGIQTSTNIYNAINLNIAQPYEFWVRADCGDGTFSSWSGPFVFNTMICEPSETCLYKFILTDNGGATGSGNGWDGGKMQLRQNGILVKEFTKISLGNTTISVALCPYVPFDLFWSVPGTAPNEIGIAIQNPFLDVIYTKAPGTGVPETTLYSSVANCTPAPCSKPTNMTAITTQTSATLAWTDNSVPTSTSFDLYIVPTGEPAPINVPATAPTISNISNNYTLTTLNGLPLEKKSYTYYVRANCGSGTYSTWTISSPISFALKPINDECINAINVPVNPVWECNPTLNIQGDTFGATPSLPVLSPALTGTVCGQNSNDIWYKFTATNSAHVINLSNSSSNILQVNYSVFSGSCDNLAKLYCSSLATTVAAGLIPGNVYYIRIYKNVTSQVASVAFNICISTPPAITNDECSNAIAIQSVLPGDQCSDNISFLGDATPSSQSFTCLGSADDDVWFTFVATSTEQSFSLLNVQGTTTDLNHAVYKGTCNSLTLMQCSAANSLSSNGDGFIIGQTYYVRVWSNSNTKQVVKFTLCIKSTSTCVTAQPFCGSSPDDPYIFPNTNGFLSNLGSVACLTNSPDPVFYTLKIAETGPITFEIRQSSDSNNFPQSGSPGIDVDYVCWGPFNSPSSCDQIAFSDCPTCPNNTTNATFYPFGNIVDCSYDAATVETLTIQNAIAGQYYIVMITNFSYDPGYIKLAQTNIYEPNAGQTYCADKILLVSYLDENNNGIKDNNESNFNLGSFSYQKNNAGIVHHVSSPLGKHNIYDANPANTYDFSYQINPEFAAYYSLAPTSFNDINIPVGGGTQTLFFPVSLTQTYNDVSVSIVPIGTSRPGSSYINKIVYRNLSPNSASGTLTFTKDTKVTINNVSQSGIVNTVNGFSYDFTNLLPYETRSFDVKMYIPSIPTVNISDILTNTVTISAPASDINLVNNTFTNSQQVVGSYDPNDKIETHGNKIQFNQFNQNDYLFYTIRFQNTGNANAINIRLEDLLNDKLDEASIRVISSSHNYIMERDNNKIIWNFDNIQLPASIQNEELSKGYVSFMIKLKPGFAAGDIIPNFANIYFDSNPAITTNTFQTEFVTALGNDDFNSNNFVLFPNPTDNIVHIDLLNTVEKIKAITFYNILGESIKEIIPSTSKQIIINVSDLAKGVYIVEIITENKLKQIKKLIIK